MLALIVQILPTILQLINKLVAAAHDAQMISAGRSQAIADAHQALGETIAIAQAAAQAAEAEHVKDATDAAFDQEFKRGN